MSWLDEYDDTSWYNSEVVSAGDQEFQDFMTGAAGDQEFQDFMTQAAEADSGVQGFINSAIKTLGDGAKDFLKKYLYNPETKELNLAGIGAGTAALYGLMGGNQVQTGGYNKPIPKLTATREQIPYAADPNRRPGEGGRQYFTDQQYTDAAGVPAAQTAAKTQAQGILAAYTPRPKAVNPYQAANYTPTPYKPAWNPAADTTKADTTTAASGVAALMPVPKPEDLKFAAGGGLAAGGFVVPADVVAHFGNGSSSAGLVLLAEKLGAKPIKGKGDGMSDSIPTHIDGKEKALVANDEAYIDPRMVKRIGGGDMKKGSEKLYAMMEKIRKARTGNPEQGKKINPEKFMPGGIAQLAGGGTIYRFDGTIGSTVPPVTTPAATPLGTSTSSSLSPWAGDYVTNYLGKGQALAEAPYQSFQGPLTAGSSDLQNQAFAGIGSLAQEGYKPQTYQGGTFDATQAQNYMNPYLSAALNPQLAEMGRQANITRVADAGRMTQAGAFGGSRQAIMESEGNRNLLDKQGAAIGQGYQSAYDKAVQQFNTEQDRRLGAEKSTEASRQYSADYGLKSLGEAASLGAVQRGIDTEGINADRQQFEEQRDYPLKMAQYQKDLLQGLPITSNATTANTTGVSQISNEIKGLMGLYKTLAGLGQAPAATTPAANTAVR
jgi:hypothetical protein